MITMSRNSKIGAAIIGALSVIGGVSSVSGVDTGSAGVVSTFGKIERTVGEGLCFHWPWQSLTQYSLKSRTVDIHLEVYSKDSQLAPDNILSVTFSLPKESVMRAAREFGPDYFGAVLKNPIENIFREAFGQRTADQIIANREELNQEVSRRLKLEFDSRGVHFETLGISIKFNDAFNRSAEESAIARTKVNTAEQDLKRKEIEARQQIVQSKGEADANYEKRAMEAKGIRDIGDAEAAVMEKKAAVLKDNPGLVNYLATEKWDGKLPTTMIPGGSTPFVEVDLAKANLPGAK